MNGLKRRLLSSAAWLLVCAPLCAASMNGGTFLITKDLSGATGPNVNGSAITSTDYVLVFAWGEPVAGNAASDQASFTLLSGYFGGRFGNSQTFQLSSSRIGTPGTKTFFQDRLQVGLPFDAPLQLTFADQIDENSIAQGVQVFMATDHMGRPAGVPVPVTVTSDPNTHNRLTLQPQTAWAGNTLYDVQVNPNLLNVDGFALDRTYHIEFVTLLDPHQDNVV